VNEAGAAVSKAPRLAFPVFRQEGENMTMRGLFAALVAAMMGVWSLASDGQTILAYPWGQSITVTSTSTTTTVRQHKGTNLVYGSTSDWSLGDGWAISNGHLHAEGADCGLAILSNVTIQPGQGYYISFDVTNMAAGGDSLPGVDGVSNVWIQAALAGYPTEQYSQAVVGAASTIEAGFRDRNLEFMVSLTNATKVSVSNIVLYAYDDCYAKAVSIINTGSESAYLLPNVTETVFDAAYTAGTTVVLPAGSIVTLPLTGTSERRYGRLVYRTASATTTLVFLAE